MKRSLALVGFGLASSVAVAQPMPPASRTVYRCEVEGRVVYTDTPCLAARKVDVEPTRGLDASSGRTRVGADVRLEQQRERTAEQFKPLTGMDAPALDRETRRLRLSPQDRRACRELDRDIPAAEDAERRAEPQALPAAQRRLYQLRAAWQRRGCG